MNSLTFAPRFRRLVTGRAWSHVAWCSCVALLVAVAAPDALAQPDSRAAEIAARKAEKAQHAQPPGQGPLEMALNLLQEEVGAAPVGFYPYVGSVFSGGWLAFGGGYRHPVGDTGVIDVEGAYSLQNYWRTQVRLRLPRFARDRGSVQLRHTLLDAPEVAYFGIGPDSDKDSRAHYAFRRGELAAEFRYQVTDHLRLGADALYDAWNTRPGGGGFPSIEEIFDAQTAPGIGANPDFLALRAFAQLDWRNAEGYTRRGGYAKAAFTRYDARGGAPYDFSRLDLGATHHVPLYRENWVLAFRGLFSATSTSDGHEVPYFLLPMLGESSDEFRGYSTFRFRDRHRVLLTGEYRWMPSHYLDLALFLDAGNVAPEIGGLDLGSLKTAWGLSARLHTPVDTLLHASIGRGREGWRLIVGFGQIF